MSKRGHPTLTQIATYYENNPDMVCGVLTSGFFSLEEKKQLLSLFLGDITGKAVLDVGCGDGKLADLAAPMGVQHYVGVDISSMLVAAAREQHPEWTFLQGDMHNLARALGPDKFDIVLLLDVWEHATNPDESLLQARTVLKQDGLLMITVPNYANVAGLKKLWKERMSACPLNSWAPFCNGRQQVHERFTTAFQLRRALKRTGFHILVERGWDIVASFFPSIYAEAALQGFWSRHSYWHYRLNRAAMNLLIPLTSTISMYYLVSAASAEDHDRGGLS